jgi:hypothetical protein
MSLVNWFIIYFILFVDVLFEEAASSCECIASNDMIINKKKEVKGDDRGLI